MGLVDLWQDVTSEIAEKRLFQLIAFAGDGKLRDGNETSREFRNLLRVVSSDRFGNWIDECLDERFQEFGFVLQDIVNEIGRRLGFEVRDGVYRGHTDEGYDGLWVLRDRHAFVVESKSSTDFQINLTRISHYRQQVAGFVGIDPEEVSILLVVGSENTSELEAQVRGSRFAWNVRILGMRALARLLTLKESLDDPSVERQIQEILIPQEFTRLDHIVNLVFSTVEDVQDTEEISREEAVIEASEADSNLPATVPVKFNEQMLPKIEKQLDRILLKAGRVIWSDPDSSFGVSVQASKEYQRGITHYWFGLKRTTKTKLDEFKTAYCCFGLATPDRAILLPKELLEPHLAGLFTSPDERGDIRHWHVRFERRGEQILLMTNRDQERIDVTEFLMKT